MYEYEEIDETMLFELSIDDIYEIAEECNIPISELIRGLCYEDA